MELPADFSVCGCQNQHPASPMLQLQNKRLWIFRAVLLGSLMRLLREQSDPSSQSQTNGHTVPSAPARCCVWLRQNQMYTESEPGRPPQGSHCCHPLLTHLKTPGFLGRVLVYLIANYTSENIFKCDVPCHTAHLEAFPPSQHTHTIPLLSVYVSVSTLVLSLK